MRIVHVVTVVANDGAFGGPLRVALNDLTELRRRGHDVLLVAGHREPSEHRCYVDGVPAILFPVIRFAPIGFSGLLALGMLRWLRRELRSIDVIHIHLGRDVVTLSALGLARAAGRAVVVQTHGMVTPDARMVVRILDALVARPLLRAAAERLALTEREDEQLRVVLGPVSIRRLRNGVPAPRSARTPGAVSEVLFLARLHARKRPSAFVTAAETLHPRHPEVRWVLVGPDEGELEAIQDQISAAGLDDVVRYEGSLPYERVAKRLEQASIYVLPSVDEPFPMSLLEALRAGVPSICTDSCGIAPQLAACGAALVIGPEQAELNEAIEMLLDDAAERARLGQNAQATIRNLFSIESVVDDLESIYSAATAGTAPADRAVLTWP